MNSKIRVQSEVNIQKPRKKKLLQIEAKMVYKRTPKTLHMMHHGSKLGGVHLYPPYDIFCDWQQRLHQSGKKSLNRQEGVPKIPILPSYESCNFMNS